MPLNASGISSLCTTLLVSISAIPIALSIIGDHSLSWSGVIFLRLCIRLSINASLYLSVIIRILCAGAIYWLIEYPLPAVSITSIESFSLPSCVFISICCDNDTSSISLISISLRSCSLFTGLSSVSLPSTISDTFL